MTATVVRNPNRSLTLNSDGSFVYTPLTNYFGTDSFTYSANDGNLSGVTATVFITVNSGGTLIFSSFAYSRDEDSGSATISVSRIGGASVKSVWIIQPATARPLPVQTTPRHPGHWFLATECCLGLSMFN